MTGDLTLAAPLKSNPFATRYTRPGAITYQFSLESRSDLPLFGAACLSPSEFASKAPSDADAALCEIIGRLKAHQGNLIVGPHGTGKTTLLHSLLDSLRCSYRRVDFLKLDGRCGAWMRRFQDRVVLHAKVHGRLKRMQRGDLMILDGFEQLNAIFRWLVLLIARRNGFTVLATGHKPIFGMQIIFETAINPNLIHHLSMQLLHSSPDEIRKEVQDWLTQYDLNEVSNLRELWFELYDVVQPHLICASQEKFSS
ncbi:MAG: hypothetical protein VXZ38_06555 [Planctomycetota bacterium]|nr:hypothetical protein [Planctomycetota bacterium]